MHSLLRDSGLAGLHKDARSGRTDRTAGPNPSSAYAFLDLPEISDRLVRRIAPSTARIRFHLPAIHCPACVSLLENLFRIQDGVGRTTVNFPRQEASIEFDPGRIHPSEMAALLDSLGYPPQLDEASVTGAHVSTESRKTWIQTGIAGFAFGNTMLFSLAGYLGLVRDQDPQFHTLFGWTSLVLSIPVVLISARPFFERARAAIQARHPAIEIPIAVGIVVIWLWSAWEVASRRGDGYFDSLAGLLFFLNLGRAFQQRTFERLAFDRDYRSFFPLAASRIHGDAESRVALAALRRGDRIAVRHGEIIPADSKLLTGEARIDYSFVTGESDPVSRGPGEKLPAGGRQTGGLITLEVIEPVRQSELTRLWNHEVFDKARDDASNTWINLYSRRFTWIVALVAIAAGLAWLPFDPARGLKAFVSVLIVACPCALALASPLTLGSGIRVLARQRIFARNTETIERLAEIDHVVFDKTGTLTSRSDSRLEWQGASLTPLESSSIRSLAGESMHPISRAIATAPWNPGDPACAMAPITRQVTGFRECPGKGISGIIDGAEWLLGSAAWLGENGIPIAPSPGARVFAGVVPRTGLRQTPISHRARQQERMPAGFPESKDARDGCLGSFSVVAPFREGIAGLLRQLPFPISILTGDNDRDLNRLESVLPRGTSIRFHQSPLDKLESVRALQKSHRVLMVGDGLNDAGALRQAHVGIAVAEDTGMFCPASDLIVDATELKHLDPILEFCRRLRGVVRANFAISAVYNAGGIVIAASGLLSPVVCAVLMPLSSLTVWAAATGLTTLAAKRARLTHAIPENASFRSAPGTHTPAIQTAIP